MAAKKAKAKTQSKAKKLTGSKPSFYRYIIFAVILAFIVFLFNVLPDRSQKSNGDIITRKLQQANKIKETVKPPAEWKYVTEEGVDVIVKLQRNSASTYKPAVVLIETGVSSSDNKQYVDRLIKGARVTLPSLTIMDDNERIKNGVYIRDLTGTFLIGRQTMNIRQYIIVKDNSMYTLTGISEIYESQQVQEELTSLIDQNLQYYGQIMYP